MNWIDCNIICDLLPIYIDKICSKQTEDLVEKHLQTCKTCKKRFDQMNKNIPSNIIPPVFDSKKFFCNIREHILGMIIAISLMISCFVINASAVIEGSVAEIGNLIATIVYVIFWCVFSVISKKYVPMIKAVFIISLFTFISAANGLVWNLLGQGGFVSEFISILTSIPFYGIRTFMGWRGLYVIATVFSFGWVIYSGVYMNKLKKSLREKVIGF